jgi:hypothetical protein
VRFGVCTWVWSSPLRDADVGPLAERTKAVGFDGPDRAVSLRRPLDAEGDALAAGGLAFLRESVA